MKYKIRKILSGNIMSLPSRERGLKFEEYSKKGGRIAVAPLAGAWIEMLIEWILQKMLRVAPLAGAWIEIAIADPLTNMRSVAPLAGAWIEISGKGAAALTITSLPSRERGLKYCKNGEMR